MSREDDLVQNLDDISGLVDQVIGLIVAADANAARLEAEIVALVTAGGITAAKVQAAFDKSEAAENKLRAVVPGVPPVGGTPLLTSYADRAGFDAALAAYTGPEAVNVDGSEVKAGTAPALDYYTHSADGSVNTMGPTD